MRLQTEGKVSYLGFCMLPISLYVIITVVNSLDCHKLKLTNATELRLHSFFFFFLSE